MTTTRMARFEGYAPPNPSIATAIADVDAAVAQAATVPALQRANDRLHLEANNHRRCAEAEREESSRLRNQNRDLAIELRGCKSANPALIATAMLWPLANACGHLAEQIAAAMEGIE